VEPGVNLFPKNTEDDEGLQGSAYQWLAFEGRWGGETSGFAKSPEAPRRQSMWTNPSDWGGNQIPWDNVEPCGSWLRLIAQSPVEIHVYDSEERHVGLNDLGGVDLQIPGSEYITIPDTEIKGIFIPDADITIQYRIVVKGIGIGTFDLSLVVPDVGAGALHMVGYEDVGVNQDTSGEIKVQPGTNFTLNLDSDGDGIVDEAKAADKIEMVQDPLLIACGDQNGDGAVDVFDVIIDLQITVGIIVPTPTQQILSDLNQDGVINVFDAIIGLQHIVGLIPSLDQCGPL